MLWVNFAPVFFNGRRGYCRVELMPTYLQMTGERRTIYCPDDLFKNRGESLMKHKEDIEYWGVTVGEEAEELKEAYGIDVSTRVNGTSYFSIHNTHRPASCVLPFSTVRTVSILRADFFRHPNCTQNGQYTT